MQRDDRSVSSSKACDATDQLVCLIVAASQLEFVLGQVWTRTTTHKADMTSFPTIVACTSFTKLILPVSVQTHQAALPIHT